MSITTEYWRNCSQCKKQLAYKAPYYECSVSTCSRKRTGYVFCSILCWEAHVPGANHRNAGAIEKRAPTYEQWVAENAAETSTPAVGAEMGQRRIVVSSPQSKPASGSSSMSQEVLVVVSKMKQYIKDRADMNTSGDVGDILSDIIRRACDDAIDEARADGRKTVMARDFKQK